MNGKTCFFIGNRHTPSSIKEQLVDVVEQHITEYGVTTFIVGRYGAFDSMVQGVLRESKKSHTDIELYISKQVGHSDTRVTLEVYTEILEELPAEANKRMDEIIFGSQKEVKNGIL